MQLKRDARGRHERGVGVSSFLPSFRRVAVKALHGPLGRKANACRAPPYCAEKSPVSSPYVPRQPNTWEAKYRSERVFFSKANSGPLLERDAAARAEFRRNPQKS